MTKINKLTDYLRLEVMTGGFVTGAPDPDPNLLTNGDFETDASGWFGYPAGTALTANYRVTPGANTGSYYLTASNGTTAYQGVMTAPGVNGFRVKAGKWYKVSLMVQETQYYEDNFLEFYDSEGVFLEQHASNYAITTGFGVTGSWFNITFYAQAPAYSVFANLRAMGNSGGGVAIDTVSVTEVTVGTNLFPRGNMESGVSDWVMANGTAISSTSDARTGTKALTFTHSALNTNMSLATASRISVTAGKTYFAAAWGKVTGVPSQTEMVIRWYNSSGTSLGDTLVFRADNTGGEYTQWSTGGVAPTGAVKADIRVFSADPGDAAFVIITLDDVVFYEVIAVAATTTPSNLLQNPSGARGAWGWVSPTANTNITTGKDANGSYLKALDSSTSTATISYLTELTTFTPGKSLGGRVQIVSVSNAAVKVRARFNWYNASGVLTTSTAFTAEAGVGLIRVPAVTPPAGTVYVALELSQSRTGVLSPTQGDFFLFRQAMIAEGTLAQVGTSLAYGDYGVWTNIINDSTFISMDRQGMDTGLMSTSIHNAVYDPTISDTLRPGRPIRVRTVVGTVWENLYEGAIDYANVDYVNDGLITITASDANAELANRAEYRGVEAVSSLPFILEGAGVPWNVNGTGNQVASATVVSYNDNASILDQVAVTRDTKSAYAWVDRYNVLNVFEKAYLPTSPVIEFRDDPPTLAVQNSYSTIEAGLDTRSIINSVTVTWLRKVGTESEEIVYGPYKDQNSINTWGTYSANYTIHGATENATSVANFAQAILTANATPTTKVNALTFPIRDTRDLPHSIVDLYDRVAVTYKDKVGVRQRVSGIKHDIQPGRWIISLDFESEGTVATPTFVPSPPPIASIPVSDTGWLSSTTGWTLANSANWIINSLDYRRKEDLVSIFVTMQYLGATTITSTTAGNISDQQFFTTPATYRPIARATANFEIGGVSGGTARMEADGRVSISNLDPNATIATNNTLWFSFTFLAA